jgi:hypothetical protein
VARLQATVIVRSIVHRDSAARKSALMKHHQPSQRLQQKTHLLSHNALDPGVHLNLT